VRIPFANKVAFTLVRYFDDVRRANANMLTPTEFYHRTLLDLHFVASPELSLDQVANTDIQLEQFLSWQLAKRIQTKLIESLAMRGISSPETVRCTGEYQNGEFAFALVVDQQQEGDWLQGVFQDAAGVVAQVLGEYRFNSFQAIKLTHQPSGRTLLLPKTRLDLLK
jgi:hypothetical protein